MMVNGQIMNLLAEKDSLEEITLGNKLSDEFDCESG